MQMTTKTRDSLPAMLGASWWQVLVAVVAVAIGWSKLEQRLHVIDQRTDQLEGVIPTFSEDVRRIQSDLDALIRLQCVQSTPQQQRLAGMRCGGAGGSVQ